MQVQTENIGPRTGPAREIALWIEAGAEVIASPRQWRRIARHLSEPITVYQPGHDRAWTYKPSRRGDSSTNGASRA